MSDRLGYHRDIAAAREVALRLAGKQAEDLLGLLADYADELAALVRAGVASPQQRRVFAEVAALTEELTREMASRVGAGVRLAARQVAEAHARALLRILPPRLAGAVEASFAGVNVRAAQAVLARPELAAAFRTLRAGATQEANGIIRRGILRGAGPQGIERELRAWVGAPGTLVEGDAQLLADRRRIGYAAIRELGYDPTPENLRMVRRQAAAVSDKARLIGRQEVMTAEHETHVAAVEVSPVVRCLQVKLSGRHPVRDICDVAAETDLYGLGPGRYPPEKVPTRFHPRCLCRFSHVLRDAEEWAQPRPSPPSLRARWRAIQREHELSPSAVRQLKAAILVGDRRAEPQRRAA
jgi:hypothetical protein